MRKTLVGVSLALISFAVPAHADWYQIPTSSTNAKWLMDPARLKMVGGKMQAWVKIDYSSDRSVQYNSAMLLMSFDCDAQTYKTLSETRYDSYGKIVSSANAPDYGYGIGYIPVVPDSMAETVEKMACPSK